MFISTSQKLSTLTYVYHFITHVIRLKFSLYSHFSRTLSLLINLAFVLS